MKTLTVLFLVLTVSILNAQNDTSGFPMLFAYKAKIERLMEDFRDIPDSLQIKKKEILTVKKQYEEVCQDFDAFKGSLIGCLNENEIPKKAYKCMAQQKGTFEVNLKTLRITIETIEAKAYGWYIPPTKSGQQSIESISDKMIAGTSGNWAVDIAEGIIKLISGITEEIIKIQKERREAYIKLLQSPEYSLKRFNVIVGISTKD